VPFAVVDQVVRVVVSLVKAHFKSLDECLRKEGFQLRIQMIDVCPVVSGLRLIEVLQPHGDECVAIQIRQDVVLQLLAAGQFGPLDGFFQDGLAGDLSNGMTDQHLPGLIAVDFNVSVLHTHPGKGAVTIEGPCRNIVEMAMEADCIVFTDKVFLHSILWMCRCPAIWGEEWLFFIKGFCRDTFGGTVWKAVRSPGKPTDGGLVQHLNVGEVPAAKEPVLDIFHDILHFPFRLRVAFPAEHTLKVFRRDKSLECFRKYHITKVLTMDKNLVLIICYFPWLAIIELESKLVGVYCQLRSERGPAEIDELLPAEAHDSRKEVYLDPSGVIPVHPVLSEVRLHGYAGFGFRELFKRSERLLVCLWNMIFFADSHDEVEYRLFAHGRKVLVMFPQVIMNLAA